jgi:hypothetical protein
MREKSGNQVPVMGWVAGALAEAGDLKFLKILLFLQPVFFILIKTNYRMCWYWCGI